MIVRLVVDSKDKDIVARNLPRLQNAYLAEMISYLGVTVHEGQPLDVAGIRRRLVISAQKTLEGPYVKDVIVENPNLK
jgi:flagellar protein FliL